MADLSEQVALANLVERLASNFADLPADRVTAAVEQARIRFDDSPIRDFVPLLVERRARAELTGTSR